jgi:nucleotide-binding universal stress UspA family protein
MVTLEHEAEAYLDGVADTFRAEGYTVNTEVSAMPAAEAILDYAEAQHADLIAIATHGRSGISRFVFGSVTQKVVQTAPVPVLVIRPKAS